MLDTHIDMTDTHSVKLDDSGFTVVVHDPNNFPLTAHKGIKIQPGKETMVAISAIDIKSDHQLKRSSPKRRNCHFPDDEEAQLNMYQNYSQVKRLHPLPMSSYQ